LRQPAPAGGRGERRLADRRRNLGTIRRIVEINLVLGLLTAAIGASGRYWGG